MARVAPSPPPPRCPAMCPTRGLTWRHRDAGLGLATAQGPGSTGAWRAPWQDAKKRDTSLAEVAVMERLETAAEKWSTETFPPFMNCAVQVPCWRAPPATAVLYVADQLCVGADVLGQAFCVSTTNPSNTAPFL